MVGRAWAEMEVGRGCQARMKSWGGTDWGAEAQPSEVETGKVETQVEPRRQRPRVINEGLEGNGGATGARD